MSTPTRLVLGTLAAIALTSPTAPAAGQWMPESPSPTALSVGGLAAPTPSRLLLATADDPFDQGGALFESLDGGAGWHQRPIPESLASGFHGITFVDSQHGWAWGNESYRTIDGGDTWQPLPVLGSTYEMAFSTPLVGLAGGNFGTAMTLDGGLSWFPSPDGISQLDLRGLIGLATAADGIRRTADAAQSFALALAGDARDVRFLTDTVALAIVDDTIWRSEDSGLTWSSSGPALGRSELVRVSETVALGFGRSGTFPDFDDRILRSTTGGLTWSDLGDPIGASSVSAGAAVTVVDSNIVIIADGSGGLHRSADAGATWVRVYSSPGPTPSFLGDSRAVFPDSATGFYAFGPGLIVGSGDGGATWTQVSSGTSQGLLDLGRFVDGHLVAVGEGGVVTTREAADSRWTFRTTLGTTDLVAVQVLGAATAIATNRVGQLWITTDRGNTWSASGTPPAGFFAYDVAFATPLEGAIVGVGSSSLGLVSTLDGGQSWTAMPEVSGLVVGLERHADLLLAVRQDGILQRSPDAGVSWTTSSLPGSPGVVHDLALLETGLGIAVGSGGYAARTTDGGATWQMLATPDVADDLTAISLSSPTALWVVASSGRLLFSATQGDSWAAIEPADVGFATFGAVVDDAGSGAWIAGWQGQVWRFAGPPPPPLNWPPTASFDFATTGLAVTFTDTSTDVDGSIVSWQWDFGDGSTSTLQHPTHTFATSDTYIVALTVLDDDADGSTTVRFIAVQPGPGGTFGDFTEVTPLDPLFVTPQDEDFWVSAAAGADYDGDGDLDLAVLGYYVVYNQSVDERLVLFRNDGAAAPDRWSLVPIDLPLGNLIAGASDLTWGDVDGDGDADLVVASDGEAVLYRNQAGVLQPTDTTLAAYWEDNDQADFDLESLSWADFDNDGDLDLLMPSVWDEESFSYRTVLLRNDGANPTGDFVFTDVDAPLAGTSHAQSRWADFDHDLDLDLLLINLAPLTNQGFIRRYRNDGNGLFTPEDILGTLTIEHGEGQWGDYDADGDLDILIAGHIQEPDGGFNVVLRIYRNDAETYVPIEVIECPACDGWFDVTAASWGDYDSDGDIDILVAGTYNSGSNIEGRAMVYANDGGIFSPVGDQLPAPRASGTRGGSFTWLDLDGDADLDYFIAGQYFVPGGNGLVEAQMHVYRNDTSTSNQPPAAPAQAGADVSLDGVVSLWWLSGTDDTTPPDALTYDLELSRNGAAVSVPRHQPRPGNLGAVDQWSLQGLADGLYHWGVKAIDTAFNSSAKRSGTFRVGPAPVPIFSDGFEAGNLSAWSNSLP